MMYTKKTKKLGGVPLHYHVTKWRSRKDKRGRRLIPMRLHSSLVVWRADKTQPAKTQVDYRKTSQSRKTKAVIGVYDECAEEKL